MLNMLKSLVVLAVIGLFAGCSTNSSVDAVDTGESTEAEAVSYEDTSATEEAVVEDEPEVAADTVFYFEFDSAALTSEARAALLVHAEKLSVSPSPVRLEGHADERGSREYNMALGERRANAVRDFLVLQGVSASYIETISYGEERPIDSGSYEGAWSQNRRVELK